jgi:ABC-2 type transport system ATP-binding protein
MPAGGRAEATQRAGAGRATAVATSALTKRFGDRVAYEEVTLEVHEGEVFGLLGPNGAGKTTLVRTLTTLVAPSAGHATVAGLAVTEANALAIRKRVGVMPETPGLYLRLSVQDNLRCFAELRELPDPAAEVRRVLEVVGMTGRAQDPCGALSKGLRQRVSLARALLGSPAVLFLDEPTSGLDPGATREVLALVDDLRQGGATVVLTTHRLEEAERLCDRVAILATRLRRVGRPGELRRRLFGAALTLRTAGPLADPGGLLGGVPGVQRWRASAPATYHLEIDDPRHAAPALVRALVAAGADVLELTEERHSLEDVYLQLVGKEDARR